MIGVDTNILVRAILEDDAKQAKIAQSLLKKLAKNKQLFISSHTLLEMVWVLKGRERSREDICQCVLDLIDSPGIIIGQKEVVISALEKYRKGKADFGDYMILAEGEYFGTAELASFDKILCKDTANCLEPGRI